MNYGVRFGRRVRELRKAAGLTQSQLAERAGLNPRFVGSIERAEQNPTLMVIGKLAVGLELHPRDLFDFDHQQDVPTLKK
jgi:transcriptional regulator with XRE-family HTH domain